MCILSRYPSDLYVYTHIQICKRCKFHICINRAWWFGACIRISWHCLSASPYHLQTWSLFFIRSIITASSSMGDNFSFINILFNFYTFNIFIVERKLEMNPQLPRWPPLISQPNITIKDKHPLLSCMWNPIENFYRIRCWHRQHPLLP